MKALETSDKRADDAEKRYEELIKKIEAKVQDQSLVANSEKPGPEKVEEADPEDPTGESSQLQTTGGNLGDSEGEVTFTRPATPPSPSLPQRENRRGWRKERRESGNASMSTSEEEIQENRERKDHMRRRKSSSSNQADEEQIRGLKKLLKD